MARGLFFAPPRRGVEYGKSRSGRRRAAGAGQTSRRIAPASAANCWQASSSVPRWQPIWWLAVAVPSPFRCCAGCACPGLPDKLNDTMRRCAGLNGVRYRFLLFPPHCHRRARSRCSCCCRCECCKCCTQRRGLQCLRVLRGPLFSSCSNIE